MFLTVALFQQPNRYDIFCEPLGDVPPVSKRERDAKLAEWAQRYATRLESYVRSGPLNWFNF